MIFIFRLPTGRRRRINREWAQIGCCSCGGGGVAGKAILNYCIYLSRLTKNAAAFVVRNGEFVRTMQYNVLYNAHCARMSDVPPDVYAVKYRLGFSQYARNHSHI